MNIKLKDILIIIIFSVIMSCNFEQDDKVISSSNPPTEIAEQFGQLIGEWKCNVANLQQDNTWKKTAASWEFKYILNGHAIQDYWKHPSKIENDTLRVLLGTNVRIFNTTLKKWQCMWIENKRNTMSGIWEAVMNDNNEIIIKDSTDNWEIKFFNIKKDHFDWKWDFRQPDGAMKTTSKIKAERVI